MELFWQAHVGGYVTYLWGLYRIVINTIALDTLVGVSLLKLFLWHIILHSQAVVHFLVTAEETTAPKETTVPGIRAD